MKTSPQHAIILLSGGLDSATTLAIAHSQGYTLHALSFDYGQRHKHELLAAQKLAAHYQVAQHITMNIDLRAFGHSALTADIPVPKDKLNHPSDPSPLTPDPSQIPITYVPARNTVFLSFALAFAETTAAQNIFLGVNAIDYSGYPDCRPEFIAAFQTLANLATRAGVEGHHLQIHTPLIHLSKADIIKKGLELKVPYELTHSCYDPLPDGTSCGHCDACLLRLEGFKQAGAKDPLPYA